MTERIKPMTETDEEVKCEMKRQWHCPGPWALPLPQFTLYIFCTLSNLNHVIYTRHYLIISGKNFYAEKMHGEIHDQCLAFYVQIQP